MRAVPVPAVSRACPIHVSDPQPDTGQMAAKGATVICYGRNGTVINLVPIPVKVVLKKRTGNNCLGTAAVQIPWNFSGRAWAAAA